MSEAHPVAREPAPPRVSIIVPTYNRARVLARLLRALELQTVPVDTFEVIVVDDGSTDATASVLAEEYRYRLLALAQANAGPAAARNAGIARASGELLLFVDDDVIPEPDLIAVHLDAHQTDGMAVVGRLVAPDERQPFWAEWELKTLDRQYALMLAGIFDPTPRQFFTANASARKDDVVRAGLFDARYRRAEDVELAYRLEAIGIRFTFRDDARVLHDTPRTLDQWLAMAGQYGAADAHLATGGRRDHIVEIVADEFATQRNMALRALAHLTVGYPWRVAIARRLAVAMMRGADTIHLRPIALAGCSATFNMLYWHALCLGIGGHSAFWRAVSPGIAQPARNPMGAE